MTTTIQTACTCGACELCERRAALDLDEVRETVARLAAHAGLPELAGRALQADLVLCAKIASTAAATFAVMAVGPEVAAAGAAVRCNQLTAKMPPEAKHRVAAAINEILHGEQADVFSPKEPPQ